MMSVPLSVWETAARKKVTRVVLSLSQMASPSSHARRCRTR
jgi:hypothetical protein